MKLLVHYQVKGGYLRTFWSRFREKHKKFQFGTTVRFWMGGHILDRAANHAEQREVDEACKTS